ncbi:MAG: oligoendopeptidase F [Victivallaceae bacterium]|nr:oligoendopeptidase F [Victivallaceae bacterium]
MTAKNNPRHSLPARKDIPVNMTWDLAALYPGEELFEKDFAAMQKAFERFLSYEGKLAQSPEILRSAIEAEDEYSRLAEKLYTFRHLRSDEDVANSRNQSATSKLEVLFASMEAKSSWFEPEIMQIPEPKMKEFLASDALKFYRRSLEELLRERAHILSGAEERIFAALSDVLAAPDRIAEIVSDAELPMVAVTDEQGERRKLSSGNYRVFMESADRAVRRRAYRGMMSAYGKFKQTFAATLDNAVKCEAISARLHHYGSSLEASLSDDNIPCNVYTDLIDAVHHKIGYLTEYLNVRKEYLNLTRPAMYDLYNPLVPSCKRTYSYDEAKALVKAALAPLGAEYAALLDRAFNERWIDVMENKNKRSGAYSGGCYDSYSYILLNFNGTLNDVFTLAHELGHSMHSCFSNANQHYHYANYSIFVAEVASTTNELLLFEYLLKHNGGDREFRIYLLSTLADEIRATIYRQTMFAEFELLTHRLAEQSVPLDADRLCGEYRKLNDLYYGGAIRSDAWIANEWARIPHFYYDFYVYKYATGMSAAIKLSRNILSGDRELLKRYFDFLKAGDSRDVLDIMRDAGADLSTPATVEAALDYFGEVVAELKSLRNASPEARS